MSNTARMHSKEITLDGEVVNFGEQTVPFASLANDYGRWKKHELIVEDYFGSASYDAEGVAFDINESVAQSSDFALSVLIVLALLRPTHPVVQAIEQHLR